MVLEVSPEARSGDSYGSLCLEAKGPRWQRNIWCKCNTENVQGTEKVKGSFHCDRMSHMKSRLPKESSDGKAQRTRHWQYSFFGRQSADSVAARPSTTNAHSSDL